MEPATTEELLLLDKFRENVRDLELCEEARSNMSLIRWLRARHLNIIEAEKMLRQHLEWYEEQKMHDIFSYEPPKLVKTYVPYKCSGYDYLGCPILIYESKELLNIPTLMKSGLKDDFIRYNLQLFEVNGYMMRRQSQRMGLEYLVQYTCIIDLEYLNWRHLTYLDCINSSRTLAKYLEDNYPETANIIIVVNAPRVFTVAFTILKPLLSERTLSKLRLFGSNRNQWIKSISEIAPKEELPKKYGGNLPDDYTIVPSAKECVLRKRGSY